MMQGGTLASSALRDKTGVSAVEFAIIAPVLAFMLLGLVDAVQFAVAFTSMQRAERAGIQYFMNGGTSTDAAKGIVAASWQSPPSGYSVTAQAVCKCGSAITTCIGAICVNGNAFTENMTITSSATVSGILTSFPESKSESVRVH